MSKIVTNIAELVGNTPLMELVGYEKKHDLKAKVLGKLEYFNPSGSIKDFSSRVILSLKTPAVTPE